MKTVIRFALFLLVIFFVTNSNDVFAKSSLPENISTSIKNALATNDKFVINAVVNAAKAQHPKSAKEIDALVKSQTAKLDKAEKKSAEKVASLEPSAGKAAPANTKTEKTKNWKANIEAGASFATGNTNKQDGHVNTKIEYKKDKWENTAQLNARGGRENHIATSEEYRVFDQLRYNLTDRDYTFGEGEYVNNRFGGFEYRMSELIGYGRKLIVQDKFTLNGEIGAGAGQTKYLNGDHDDSILGKIRGIANWKIADNLEFAEDASIASGLESAVSIAETSLKSNFTEQLYLKLSNKVEYKSRVPASNKSTDTVTLLSLGYDF